MVWAVWVKLRRQRLSKIRCRKDGDLDHLSQFVLLDHFEPLILPQC